jgi:2-amino-4-hydroxy-6-hydroxymethyldihydropteridine diphosphokinase
LAVPTATEPNNAVVAFIGLGSNLGDPIAQLRRACSALYQLPRSRWLASSPYYRSAPMGPVPQPEYVNAVAMIETELDPESLLDNLLHIERSQGRVRNGVRWGPRTLDLDLLIYGDRVINTSRLSVPHPGIAERNFVLLPLSDLAPELIVPGLGGVADLILGVSAQGLTRLSESTATAQ